MPAIKYKATLSDDEIQDLERLIRKGKSASRSHTQTRILLKAAAGFQDQAIIDKDIETARFIPNKKSITNIRNTRD